MSDSKGMKEHLDYFFTLVDKVKEMDINISDDLLTILLLYSIPESYENFRIAIESRDELPTPEILKIKLLEEENARKNKEVLNHNESQKAFYSCDRRKYSETKKEYNMNQPFKNKSMQIICNYCKVAGHKASQCRKKQNRNYPSNKHSRNQNAMIADNAEIQAEEISSDSARICSNQENKFCFDSGATSHMSSIKELFIEIKEVYNTHVKLAIDRTVKAVGKGTIEFDVRVGNQNKRIRLENALYVPELKNNLISISKVTQNNYTVKFTRNFAYVVNKESETVMIAKRFGNLYFISPIIESTAFVKEIQQWHFKFGHLNENDLKKLQVQNMVRGLSFNKSDSLPVCKICIMGKQTATPYPKKSEYRSNELLQLIHSDISGPMRCESLGKSFYFATFIDDKSKFVHVAFLKSKDEVKTAFLDFKNLVENQLNKKIKILRTDNGLEYMGKDFDEKMKSFGIKRQRSSNYSPSQNGCAERMNRTLCSLARCLLIQANLPQKFWAEAINTAVYIRNRCPTQGVSEEKTPYEIFFGRRPSVKHLKTFGQKAFVLDKRPQRGKFDNRSKECIFIGYSEESKAYRLWDPQICEVIKARDVKFIDEFEDYSSYENALEIFFSENTPKEIKEDSLNEEIQVKKEEEPSNTEDFSAELTDDENSDSKEEIPEVEIKRGIGRPRKIKTGKPGRPKKEHHYKNIKEEKAQFAEDEYSNPTLKEALNGSYAEEWHEAMKNEYEALVKNKAWKLVRRPENKKIIGCRWVLRTKYKADGTVEKRKARLVARGFAQQQGMDYDETYAPVARPSSIRTVVAYSAEKNFTLYQLDFVMAYVNGDLKEEIFMEQAQGFEDQNNPDYVYALKKSLYGLKQSGRQWYEKLDKKLKIFGLKPLKTDQCIYKMKTAQGELILILYVDDLIISTNDCNLYSKLKTYLSEEFLVKDLGKLHFCLGIEFNQNDNDHYIILSQEKYVDNILKRFNMQDAKPVNTPLDPSIKLSKEMCPSSEDEKYEMSNVPYRCLIGSLMYLSVFTRPDITYAISYLSQFNNNPGKQHWLAAKRVLRYLKGTKNYSLKFQKTGQSLVGFSDADWASDITCRKSYTGYLFKLGGNAITWEARKQQSVALSSTEAEYISLSESAKEAIYLRKLLKELDFISDDPTIIFCDNQSAQKIVKNSVYHSRTKHIDIRYHFIREIYSRNEIDVQYLQTEEMPADIFTKALTAPKHLKCLKLIGILSD